MRFWFGETVDRVVRSGLQAFFAYVMAAQALSNIDWVAAASVTALGAVTAALTAMVGMPSFGEAWYFQVLERSIKTFAQNLGTYVVVASSFESVDWATGLDASLYAALLSVGMSVLGTRVGSDAVIGETSLTAPPRMGSSPTMTVQDEV